MSTSSTRDWSEDAPHENGLYSSKCCECAMTFVGHKRRVVCKTCAEKLQSGAPPTAHQLTARMHETLRTELFILERRAAELRVMLRSPSCTPVPSPQLPLVFAPVSDKL